MKFSEIRLQIEPNFSSPVEMFGPVWFSILQHSEQGIQNSHYIWFRVLKTGYFEQDCCLVQSTENRVFWTGLLFGSEYWKQGILNRIAVWFRVFQTEHSKCNFFLIILNSFFVICVMLATLLHLPYHTLVCRILKFPLNLTFLFDSVVTNFFFLLPLFVTFVSVNN